MSTLFQKGFYVDSPVTYSKCGLAQGDELANRNVCTERVFSISGKYEHGNMQTACETWLLGDLEAGVHGGHNGPQKLTE